METSKLKLTIALTLLIALGTTCFILPVLGVVENSTWQGRLSYTTEQNFSDPMIYGYAVHLYSTLELPPSWYLQYTMGFYLMNASSDGYYIGFHQFHGNAQLYVNPVISGVYYGMDGQPYHTALVYNVLSLFDLQVTISYNKTTNLFTIQQNNAILVQNTFSGMDLSKYKVENPLGRDQIAGDVMLTAYGPDNADFSYDNPVYNGIDFKVLTDNSESNSGGSVDWVRSTTLGIGGGETGSLGYSTIFHISDTALVRATASANYVFNSFYVSTNFTGGQFFPAGYYDSYGRLIADINLYHLFATEQGKIIATTAPRTDIVVNGRIESIYWGLTPYSGGFFEVPQWMYWSNATDTYALFKVNGPIYDTVANWQAWLGETSEVIPSSCGVYTANPSSFQYWGGNYTIYASFYSINYNPNNVDDGKGNGPQPTATMPPNWTPTFTTAPDWRDYSILGMSLGLILSVVVLAVCALLGAKYVGLSGMIVGLALALIVDVSLFKFPPASYYIVALCLVYLMLAGTSSRKKGS